MCHDEGLPHLQDHFLCDAEKAFGMVAHGVLTPRDTTSGAGEDVVQMEDDQQDSPPGRDEEKKNGTKRHLSPESEVGWDKCDSFI